MILTVRFVTCKRKFYERSVAKIRRLLLGNKNHEFLRINCLLK